MDQAWSPGWVVHRPVDYHIWAGMSWWTMISDTVAPLRRLHGCRTRAGDGRRGRREYCQLPRINVAVDHGRPVGGEGIFHYFMIARIGGLSAPSIRSCLP